jgi:SAM-dependent methyltransferase
LARPFIDFAAIGSPSQILDVGCGTGSLTFALAETAPESSITGVDHSEAYVAYAGSKASEARINFKQGDAAALPYPDCAFEVALSLLVLNFVPDAEGAAREMVRVTKPGGLVAAAVWDFRGGLTYLRMFADTAAALDAGGDAFRAKQFSAPFTGSGELATTWTNMGLHDVVQTAITIRMEFGCFDDYWQPALSGQGTVGAYVSSLSEPKRELIEQHLHRAYLAGGSDGPRSFTAAAWAARGVR